MTARPPVESSDLPTIDLSPGGGASGLDANAVGERAATALAEQGCVRLLGAFAPEFIEGLRRIHDRRYARYFPQDDYADARMEGDRRTLVTLEIEGAFNTPSFYANPYVIATVQRVLGADCILGQLAVLLSRPGAEHSTPARARTLFGDHRHDALTPANGIAMVLPFTTLDEQNGGPRVWPATQNVADLDEAMRRPSVTAQLPIGSCLLFDLRAVHAACGNRTDAIQSIGCFAYHRSWFRDWDGFERQPPISITRRALDKVPAEYRHLFDWRFDRYEQHRVRMAMRRLASRAMPAIEWAERRSARGR